MLYIKIYTDKKLLSISTRKVLVDENEAIYLQMPLYMRSNNVVVYGKLRLCQRGISVGNSEVGKNATNLKSS